MTILVLMALILAFKILDINIWKYDMLRSHHSKNYITSNYVGIGEWAFFTKSIREIGIILPIINILVILSFFGFGGVFLLALRHVDVKFFIALGACAFAFFSFVTTAATIHNYSALGIGVKGNSVNYGERVITAVVFTAIICFIAFIKSRGVLF